MATSTNILSVTVRAQDSAGTDIIGATGRLVTFTFAGSAGQYLEAFSVPTTLTAITLPKSPCLQLYIKNLDVSNYVTATWTPNGGGSNIVKAIRPGGFIAFSDLDTAATAGITALSLQANTAAVLVEMFLGG